MNIEDQLDQLDQFEQRVEVEQFYFRVLYDSKIRVFINSGFFASDFD